MEACLLFQAVLFWLYYIYIIDIYKIYIYIYIIDIYKTYYILYFVV